MLPVSSEEDKPWPVSDTILSTTSAEPSYHAIIEKSDSGVFWNRTFPITSDCRLLAPTDIHHNTLRLFGGNDIVQRRQLVGSAIQFGSRCASITITLPTTLRSGGEEEVHFGASATFIGERYCITSSHIFTGAVDQIEKDGTRDLANSDFISSLESKSLTEANTVAYLTPGDESQNLSNDEYKTAYKLNLVRWEKEPDDIAIFKLAEGEPSFKEGQYVKLCDLVSHTVLEPNKGLSAIIYTEKNIGEKFDEYLKNYAVYLANDGGEEARERLQLLKAKVGTT